MTLDLHYESWELCVYCTAKLILQKLAAVLPCGASFLSYKIWQLCVYCKAKLIWKGWLPGCWSWLLELVVGVGCWSWLLELKNLTAAGHDPKSNTTSPKHHTTPDWIGTHTPTSTQTRCKAQHTQPLAHKRTRTHTHMHRHPLGRPTTRTPAR